MSSSPFFLCIHDRQADPETYDILPGWIPPLKILRALPFLACIHILPDPESDLFLSAEQIDMRLKHGSAAPQSGFSGCYNQDSLFLTCC